MCTFPWAIANCIFWTQGVSFDFDGNLTVIFSGALQTGSFEALLRKVVVSVFTVQYFLFCCGGWSIAKCYLLCTFLFLQERFWNMWRPLNGESEVVSEFFAVSISTSLIYMCTLNGILTSSSGFFTRMFSLPASVAGIALCQKWWQSQLWVLPLQHQHHPLYLHSTLQQVTDVQPM